MDKTETTETTESTKTIKCHFLNDDNQFSGKTIELKLENIISPMCRGNCGKTQLECFVLEPSCQDLICPNYNTKNCHHGGMIRVLLTTEPQNYPTCRECGLQMVIYDKDNTY